MIMYIIRHGETDWNKEKKLQGSIDIPLNDNGRKKAEIAKNALRNVDFGEIYSSPLMRAYETADIIRADRPVSIKTEEDITEISFGECEGIQYRKDTSDKESCIYNFFNHPEKYIPPEKGETIASLRERTGRFIRKMADRKETGDMNVLVCAHGAAINAMLAYIKKLPDERFWENGVPVNCGCTILEIGDGKVRIIEENRSFN